MSERYSTENLKVKRPIEMVVDSQQPLMPYMNPWDCAERLNDLERQLKEAREALSSIRGILPTVHSSDREIHEIINKVLKEQG
jgi:predicted component of type VI protein secretion system